MKGPSRFASVAFAAAVAAGTGASRAETPAEGPPVDPVAVAAAELSSGEASADDVFARLDAALPGLEKAARIRTRSALCASAERLTKARCSAARAGGDAGCVAESASARDPSQDASCAAQLQACEQSRQDAAAAGVRVPADCQADMRKCLAVSDDAEAACKAEAGSAGSVCGEASDVAKKTCDLRARVASGELSASRGCGAACAVSRESTLTSCRREAAAEVANQRRERSKWERNCEEQHGVCLARERDVAAVGGTVYDYFPCSRYTLVPRSGGSGFELRTTGTTCSRPRLAAAGGSGSCDYERSDCRMGARVLFEVSTDSAGGSCTPQADAHFRDCTGSCSAN